MKAEIAERAVVRRLAPLANLAELLELLVVVEQALAAGECRIEPPQAEVVAPALHEHGRELARDHRVEERQVLADELLLQADRVRGDDDLWRRAATPTLACLSSPPSGFCLFRRRENRRHEIGEALADAGARLGHQMPLRRQSPARPPRPSPAAAAGARSSAAAPRCGPPGQECPRR